jgi:hypothetical protein
VTEAAGGALLRHPPVALLVRARVLSSTLPMQAVAIGWQVYATTDGALTFRLVGLARFAPMVVPTLVVGRSPTPTRVTSSPASVVVIRLAEVLTELSPRYVESDPRELSGPSIPLQLCQHQFTARKQCALPKDRTPNVHEGIGVVDPKGLRIQLRGLENLLRIRCFPV